MKSKEAYALQPDNKVIHRRYGICNVERVVKEFGVVILPDTVKGKALLLNDAGVCHPLMETNFKNLIPFEEFQKRVRKLEMFKSLVKVAEDISNGNPIQ